jgi:wobble nucleotide-excising tRNase
MRGLFFMEQTMRAILDAEEKARAVLASAQAEEAGLRSQTERDLRAYREEVFAAAKKKLADLTEKETREMKAELDALSKKIEREKSAMYKNAESSLDNWSEKLFLQIIAPKKAGAGREK